MDNGYKRAVLVWNRRSGKDKTLINFVAKKTFERVGAYYYFFPTYRQGKKILWEGRDREGFKFLDHFPKEIRDGKPNDTELKIKLINGSLFQIVGTNDIDSIVGTNPVGCVFSEYSLQDPRAWDFVRPILAENGGWAVFNYTPRGENHGWDLLQAAQSDPKNWFSQVLTVDDTQAIPREVLEQERREIIAKHGNDALFQQEYYCSFNAPIEGSYYAKQIADANAEGRITVVPHTPQVYVDTWWDLGMDDSMTIWFSQTIGNKIHLIDYYENNGEGFAHYAKVLQDRKYVYGRHNFPHDIAVRELGTGKARIEVVNSLGLKPNRTVPKLTLEDGIEAVRNIFSRCYFDQEKCRRGLNALKSYHKEYDEMRKTYRNHPEHDWSSHGADSFRALAVGFRQHIAVPTEVQGGVKPYFNLGF